jgi:hypothetical protein
MLIAAKPVAETKKADVMLPGSYTSKSNEKMSPLRNASVTTVPAATNPLTV